MKHVYHLRNSSGSPSDALSVNKTNEPILTRATRLRRLSCSSLQNENSSTPAKRSKLSGKLRLNGDHHSSPLRDISQSPSVHMPLTRSQSTVKPLGNKPATAQLNYLRSSCDFSGPLKRKPRLSRRRTVQLPSAELRVELNRLNPKSELNNHSLENRVRTPPVTLFSPRRFVSTEKDQAAKLKRLDTRRIEFDLSEINLCAESSLLDTTTESILNQSVVGDPLEKLLGICKQTEVKSFDEYFEPDSLINLVKIGEGVYGEVFQSVKSRVIKIFPVDGGVEVNGEKQMTFSGVYPEVFVSLKLSELAYKYRHNRAVNFAQLRRAAVVHGKLPRPFVSAWRRYEVLHGSENECPDFLPRDQQWIILEFEYAGEPLANMRFNNCREARSVIEQIALSLAAAESALQFEHRDLHWHNILVRPTRQWKLRYRVNGRSYNILTEGIQVTIIDFTVSRLCHEGNIVYVDMANSPEIFECSGDYQFDIYRIMRDNNRNNWRPFKPMTNLYWLHYLMGKLLNETSYPRRDPDSHAIVSELRTLHDLVLSSGYASVSQLIRSNFYFDNCRV